MTLFAHRTVLHRLTLCTTFIVLLFLSSLTAPASLAASSPNSPFLRGLHQVPLLVKGGGRMNSIPVGSRPYAVAVGDFNGDGHLDLVTANNNGNTISVLLGRGDGTFDPPVKYPVGSQPYAVAVGDFNGDGHLDLAVANGKDNTVGILLGKGDGTFAPQVTYPVDQRPEGIAVGDFNSDGHLDLVTANWFGGGDGAPYGNGDISVLLGNGDGTFAPAVSYPVVNSPASVAVGDFNGDGHLDLAVPNTDYGDNTVSVLLGNGDGTFAPQVGYPIGALGNSVAVGDFNGDGHLDLAVANFGDNTVSILLGRGDGTFAPQVTYAVGSGPYAIAVGNFNGDGHLDLVTANYYDSDVSVLLGKGDGTFAPQVTYPVGSAPASIAVGDFNGDGHLDLVTANYYDDDVSVLLGKGDGTFTSNTMQVTGHNFTVFAGTLFTRQVARVIGAERLKDLSATIDWGDSSPTSPGTVSGSDPFTISGSHTYSTEGTYTITIMVTDSTLNATSTATATITVKP